MATRRIKQPLSLGATLVLAALIGAGACSDDTTPLGDAGPGDGAVEASTDSSCASGLIPHGSACIPILDNCKQNEVPLPGGGCKQVGVVTCDGGLRGPEETSCTPVGVVECSGGLKSPDETACTPVGVVECSGGLKGPADATCTTVGPPTTCLTGWAKPSNGWCEPTLPTAPCAAGTMEVIGSSTCQPMGDCGTGTYGKIVTGAKTLFVDQAYTGGGADGTATKPYTTLADALKAAPSGAQIAVAAGTYKEDLTVKQPLTIEGRCAQKVMITGQSASTAAVDLSAKVTLRGLTISGPGEGIRVTGAEALIEHLAVQQCGGPGLLAHKGAKITLKYALLADNHSAGLDLRGSAATLEHTVVRGTDSDTTTKLGGEGVLAAAEGSAASTLTLGDCVIVDNRSSGLSIEGTSATLERTLVQGTKPRVKDTTGGSGIRVSGKLATLTVRDSVVAENQHPGVSIKGAQVTLERTIVRDTRSRDLDKAGGDGIQALFDSEGPAKLTLKQCLLEGNRNVGLVLAGAEATLERTVVQNTWPQAKDSKNGIGLQAGFTLSGEPRSKVTLKECIIANNRRQGISLWGAEATLERTVVRDTQAQLSNGMEGGGVIAGAMGGLKAELTLRDCRVTGNRSVGVQVADSKALLERTAVESTEAQAMDKMYGLGVWAVLSEVTLKECLVAGNRQFGINLMGAKVALERSVVKATRCQLADSLFGYGVGALAYNGQASELIVTNSLLFNNRTIGVHIEDSSATIERTVVRDTLSKDFDGTFGDGVQIVRGKLGPSKLTLKESIVSNNRNAGISVYGSSATIQRTIVRDTQLRSGDKAKKVEKKSVAGVEARSWQKQRSDLTLTDSVVSSNTSAGVQICGSTARLERSVIRDTASSANGELGHGVVARRLGDLSSTLTMDQCVVSNNRSVGVAALSSTATLDRTVVRDTLHRETDGWVGIGVQASRMPVGKGAWIGVPSTLTLRDSLVSGNLATGVTVASSSASIQRCIVRDTRGHFAGGGFGDGVQAMPHSKNDTTTVNIADSLVEKSFRSGAIFYAAGGSVRRSLLRKGIFAIVLEDGAGAVIGADNVYENNTSNKVAYGKGLAPAPVAGVPPID
jgi:Right handed beta helix region